MKERAMSLALPPRAQKFVDSLPSAAPLVLANSMIDEALRLQDLGRFVEAEELLDTADRFVA